jgi:PAS domain S-box-containing protein
LQGRLLGLALLEAVLLAILLVSTLRFLEVSNERQLQDHARAVLDHLVAITRNEMLNSNLAHLHAETEAFIANPGIVYVRILDAQGRVLAASGSVAALSRPFLADGDLRRVRDHIYDVSRTTDAGERAQGRIELGIDVAPLQETLAQARHWSLGIAAGGVLLISLFSMALGVYLTRQLALLREGAKRVQDGELGYQIPIYGHDELAETAIVFNAMSRQLLEDREEVATREQEQETARANQQVQMEKLVAVRTADLFEAEAQAGMILESSAAGLCGLDRNGRITFINPAACEMLGYPHDRVIGQDAHQLWHYQHPDATSYPDWECPASLALRKNQAIIGVEEVFWHAAGYPVEVILSTHPMTLGDSVVGVVLSFVDNTERKRAEERLQASVREFRALAENMPDNIARYDRKCRLAYLNPALERTLGMNAAQLLGKPISFCDPENREAAAFMRAFEAVLETGEERNIEISPESLYRQWLTDAQASSDRCALDGRRVHHVRMVAEHGLDGEVTGVLAIGRDITELKLMEAARETALKEAERLVQTKSAFLANMSHEIRTPLNAVLGMAQLGLRESRVPKSLSRFASILDAGQLLLGLVNDILDFSKIEVGKLQLELDAVNLGQVIDRAVDMVAPRAWVKGIDILVDEIAPLPESFQGDALRIIQVLVNLLSNAVKFTEQGGVYLGVRLDGDSLVFTVTDTGIGMTEAQVQLLFTPFEQADASTTRRFGGTGLGLAISKRLTDMMGGSISVGSVPEEGTEFEFRLPVTDVVLQEPILGTEPVKIVGLACADSLSEALARRGVTVEIVPANTALAEHAGLVVLPYAALEGKLLGQIKVAMAAGLRLAAVTPPGGMYAIPADLRDRLYLLDWPSRARHVLGLLAGKMPEPAVEHAPAEGSLAGVRILAAEDNELNRVVLREMLAMAGADLVCMENGRELVERLQQDGLAAYDLVITDVQMPEMDGYKAARRIRELAPALPIIGLTAYAQADERERCLAAGMSAHIGKPVNMDDLVAAVLALVRHVDAPGVPSGDKPLGGACQTDLPIDWAALEAVFPGKSDLVAKLCEILLDSHRDTPARLRALAKNGDARALALLTHNLKGVAGNMMADRVSGLAYEVNMLAKTGDPVAWARALDLARALEELLAAVACRLPG